MPESCWLTALNIIDYKAIVSDSAQPRRHRSHRKHAGPQPEARSGLSQQINEKSVHSQRSSKGHHSLTHWSNTERQTLWLCQERWDEGNALMSWEYPNPPISSSTTWHNSIKVLLSKPDSCNKSRVKRTRWLIESPGMPWAQSWLLIIHFGNTFLQEKANGT